VRVLFDFRVRAAPLAWEVSSVPSCGPRPAGRFSFHPRRCAWALIGTCQIFAHTCQLHRDRLHLPYHAIFERSASIPSSPCGPSAREIGSRWAVFSFVRSGKDGRYECGVPPTSECLISPALKWSSA